MTGTPKKILVVDDNKVFQKILSKMFKALLGDVDVDIANNGLEALTFLKNNEYEVISMDGNMPKMDGYETTQEIRKTNENVIIIAITAGETQEKFLKAGASDFIQKPFSVDKMEDMLKKHSIW